MPSEEELRLKRIAEFAEQNKQDLFEGFTLEKFRLSDPEELEKGAQAKGEWTGMYKKNGELYYIKRSKEFVADNIAEICTADLLEVAIGKQAIPYESVRCNADLDGHSDNTVYIASKIRKNPHTKNGLAQTLKDRVIHKFSMQRLMKKQSNLWTDWNKKQLADSLTDSNKADLANALAGCLWVREYDCQTGNFVFYEDSSGDERIGKFDNGWGLTGICKDKHRRVELFTKKSIYARIGTHTRGGIPTNHFNDYPDIVRSQHFSDGLKKVIDNATPEKVSETVKNTINKIVSSYNGSAPIPKSETFFKKIANRLSSSKSKNELKPEPAELTALKQFAIHIGLTDKNNKPPLDLKGIDIDTLREEISSRLTKRLLKRADSMALLRNFLDIDLALKDKTRLTQPKLDALIKNLQKTILERFNKENGYILDGKIKKLIPPYENPDHKTLLKNLISTAKEKGIQIDKNSLEFLKTLSDDKSTLRNLRNIAETSIGPQAAVLEPMGAKPIMPFYTSTNRPSTRIELDNPQQKTTEEISKSIIRGFANTNIEKLSTTTAGNGHTILINDQPQLSLHAKDDKISIQELNPALNADLKIQLMAQAIVESGDLKPMIDKGAPGKVLALLKVLSEKSVPINPQVHNDIKNRFTPVQTQQYNQLKEKLSEKHTRNSP